MDSLKFHSIIKDLPSKKFHSCILSTFSFDYNFFDFQLRRQLQRIGVMNTIVLVDARQLDDSFARFSQNTDYLLKDYTVIPIENKLCFHPKVMLFFGEENIAMHIGSGNLTSGGFGKNHELFSTLISSDKESKLYPLINCGANYLLNYLNDKKGFVQRQIDWIREHCNLLNINEDYSDVNQVEIDSALSISFVSNQNESIYKSLKEIIPTQDIVEIDIVSPFFDKECDFVNQLIQDFPNAIISIFLQNGKVEYNFNSISTDRINYFDWSATTIGKRKFKSGEKYNHSKVFIFKSANNKYFYHGSANATISAFGLGNLSNNEAGLLYESKIQEFDVGLSPKVKLEQEIFISKKNIPSPLESVKTQSLTVSINGADLYKDTIEVYIEKEVLGDEIIMVDCNNSIIFKFGIHSIEDKYLISNLGIDIVSAINALYIGRNGVKVSNIFYPCKVEYLLKCNPSKENRKFQKFLYDIEIGNTNSFEIISRLELILKEKGRVVIKNKKSTTRSTSSRKHIVYTYDDALKSKELLESDADKNIKSLHHSLELLFYIKQYLKEDKNINQDEGGYKAGGDANETDDEIFKKKKVFLSINAFEKKKYTTIQYFITYATYLRERSQLNSLNKKVEYEIASSDLIFLEQSIIHLLSLADQDLKVKNKVVVHENGDSIKVIEESQIRKVLPKEGLISSKDSLHSLLRMLLGEFTFYLMGGKFYNYEDKYSRLDQEKYINSCKKYLLTSICIYHSLFSDSSNDVELWYYLGNTCLGHINEADIEEVIFNTNFSSLKVSKVIDAYRELSQKTIQTNGKEGHYLKNQDGYYIIDAIVPLHNPTIFKLKFPGIGVLESNSDYVPYTFYKPQNRWLKSKTETLGV